LAIGAKLSGAAIIRSGSSVATGVEALAAGGAARASELDAGGEVPPDGCRAAWVFSADSSALEVALLRSHPAETATAPATATPSASRPARIRIAEIITRAASPERCRSLIASRG
jgi:hypothetical protein